MSIFNTKQAMKMAKVAIQESIIELEKNPRHMLDEGNPNHPMYDNKLFGYCEKEFMQKQY